MFESFDDATIISQDLSKKKGLTLCSIMRNENYFVAEFLRHYRRLGVERFIILDDRSDDGTREYLLAQHDVMVLGSRRRFGDSVNTPSPTGSAAIMVPLIWRSMMLSKYCFDRWAICVDADEFITLPPDADFHTFLCHPELSNYRAIYGAMLDVYPRHLSELTVDTPLNLAGGWFFDGLQHLRLVGGQHPKTHYPGVRARLLSELGLCQADAWTKLRSRLTGRRFPSFNYNGKAVLLRWGDSTSFHGSHRVNELSSPSHLLPIRHFKFTPEIYQRIEHALATGAYWNGSKEYHALENILSVMRDRDRGFWWKYTKSSNDFDSFVNSGNAVFE